MHFLPDVWVPCDECHSRRYNDDVLEVKLHGKSIADVLEMPCGDAVELFADHPKICRILQTLCDVGLDYVTLGPIGTDAFRRRSTTRQVGRRTGPTRDRQHALPAGRADDGTAL